MAYTIGEDGLLDFSGCESDDEKLDQCWDYYLEHLNEPEIVAFDGKTVRGFTEWAFDHIVSRSSNKWDTALRHDIEFAERRARCLPLIGQVIRGEIKSRCWRVSTRRGKRRAIRRVLSVVEIEHEYFIVVLEENGDAYRFRTAFPSNKEYYDHRVRDQGVNSGIWGDEK